MKNHTVTEEMLRACFARTLLFSQVTPTYSKSMHSIMGFGNFAVSFEVKQDMEPARRFTDPKDAVAAYNAIGAEVTQS